MLQNDNFEIPGGLYTVSDICIYVCIYIYIYIYIY